MERFEHVRQRLALAVATISVVASMAGWGPSGRVALAVSVGAAAIGVPHGAFDVVVGPRSMPRRKFFVVYGVLALATAAGWLVLPLLSLLIFLLASWFHFGSADAAHHAGLGGGRSLLGVATAGCAIGFPLAFHTTTVAPVLSDLLLGRGTLPADHVKMIGAAVLFPAITAGLAATAAALRAQRYEAIAELVAIGAVGAIVHPLISFAIYFLLWHSPRHVMALDVDEAAWRAAIIATVATLALGAVAWLAVEPSAVQATRVLFVGLAALSVPHLLVTESQRRARSRPETRDTPGCARARDAGCSNPRSTR